MSYISQHYAFDRVGSFKVNLHEDLEGFLTESENPDDIVYPKAPIEFIVKGGIPNFPDVNLGQLNEYNFGRFYTLKISKTPITQDVIKYKRNVISQGREFNFQESGKTSDLNPVWSLVFDSNYPLLETRTFILKKVFVPD